MKENIILKKTKSKTSVIIIISLFSITGITISDAQAEIKSRSYSVIPASQNSNLTARPNIPITAAMEKIRNQLNQIVQKSANRPELPGVAYGLYFDQNPLITSGNGIGLIASVPIASTSKIFTGFAMVRLAKSKRVDLDKPVSYYLSDFAKYEVDKKNPVTVRDLLQHRSGISYRGSKYVIINGASVPQPRSPAGSVFEYSNHNFELAGLIIAKIHGTSFSVAMQDLVFKPVGLSNTIVAGYGRGASGIHTSVHDLNQLGNYLLEDYRVNRGNSFIEEMAGRPRALRSEINQEYYGLGIRVTIRKGEIYNMYHTGQWFHSVAYLGMYPNSYVTAAFVTNPPDYRSGPAQAILDQLITTSRQMADSISNTIQSADAKTSPSYSPVSHMDMDGY
jgi:CubicO group peptidase (beta-lactamase class C family)